MITLLSRKDYPITVKFDGKSIVIPPRGKVTVPDTAQLPELPAGVQKINTNPTKEH